jgi:hypothetical protein
MTGYETPAHNLHLFNITEIQLTRCETHMCIIIYTPHTLLFFSMALPAHLQSAGLLGRVISPSQGRYLNTGQHKHRINAYTQQTSMPCVGFEPTILASERAKTVHALDRAATVIGHTLLLG